MKKYLIGNWKMNGSKSEVNRILNLIFAKSTDEKHKDNETNVVICTPYTLLWFANDVIDGLKDSVGYKNYITSNIAIGAQNVYFKEAGAYTGEISSDMLKELNCKYCIVGHSERRKYFAEDDEMVHNKILMLLEKNISPIICIGESEEEKNLGIGKEVVEKELRCAIDNIDIRYISKCIIAYEPIWAIGTGLAASASDANEMCEFIRYTIAKMYGEAVSKEVSIVYGGSANISNYKEFVSQTDIDGLLVGSASLKPEFADMVF